VGQTAQVTLDGTFETLKGTVTAVTGFYIDLRLIDKHDQTSL
jgi:exoribonuclease R